MSWGEVNENTIRIKLSLVQRLPACFLAKIFLQHYITRRQSERTATRASWLLSLWQLLTSHNPKRLCPSDFARELDFFSTCVLPWCVRLCHPQELASCLLARDGSARGHVSGDEFLFVVESFGLSPHSILLIQRGGQTDQRLFLLVSQQLRLLDIRRSVVIVYRLVGAPLCYHVSQS